MNNNHYILIAEDICLSVLISSMLMFLVSVRFLSPAFVEKNCIPKICIHLVPKALLLRT